MSLRCLIDADILQLSYEISASGQYYEPEDLERKDLIIKPFDSVSEHLDQKIREIVGEANSDESPTLYLTGDEKLLYHINRERVRGDEKAIVFKPNFRHEVAVTKEYKGNRKDAAKPYHFHNLRAYMLSEYDCIVTDGMEADDLICIHLYDDYKKGIESNTFNKICCSRDKDLRMCPGWHYGWQCGKQEQYGPCFVEPLGHIELSKGASKKIIGSGLKFFYSQLITGDTVDNIPGLPKRGPVFAYNLLSDCTSEIELFEAVRRAYYDNYGEAYEQHLREQTDLLWMIQEINEDGTLKFYQFPQGTAD